MREEGQSNLNSLIPLVDALLKEGENKGLRAFLLALQEGETKCCKLTAWLDKHLQDSSLDFNHFLKSPDPTLQDIIKKAQHSIEAYRLLIAMLSLLPFKAWCIFLQADLSNEDNRFFLVDFLGNCPQVYHYNKEAIKKWFETKNSYHNPDTREQVLHPIAKQYLEQEFNIQFRQQASVSQSINRFNVNGIPFVVMISESGLQVLPVQFSFDEVRYPYVPSNEYKEHSPLKPVMAMGFLIAFFTAATAGASVTVWTVLLSSYLLYQLGSIAHRLVHFKVRHNNLKNLYSDFTLFENRSWNIEFQQSVQTTLNRLEEMTGAEVDHVYQIIRDCYHPNFLGFSQSTSSLQFYKEVVKPTDAGHTAEQKKQFLYYYINSTSEASFNTGNPNEGKKMWGIAMEAIERVFQANSSALSAGP